MRKIANSDHLRLKELSLIRVDIAIICPLLVSEAAVKLEKFSTSLDNSSSFTNPGLVGVIVQRIGQCRNLRLRELKMNNTKLSSVPESILVGAISRLEKLSLSSSSLTASQLMAIFTLLSSSVHHKLRSLDLSFNDLSSVPTELLATALTSGPEEVILNQTSLTVVQLTGIFTQLSLSEHHKVRILDLSNNNLSSVPAETLVTAIMSGVREVRLPRTNLTADQLTGIYTTLVDRKPQSLRRINLDGNDHSSIPSDLLERSELNYYDY